MAPPPAACQTYNNETIEIAVSELVRNEAFDDKHTTKVKYSSELHLPLMYY
jgi:hypothetical protein